MIKLLSKRGFSICRACNSENLVSVLNLGDQPLPAEYGIKAEDVIERFPLNLRVCQDCSLGQLAEYVLPNRIFHKNYPYLSSASNYWLNHSRNFAKEMCKKFSLNSNSLVMELASNDGYLLSEFKKSGIPVIGIEPTKNTANIARAAGIPTISKFFGEELARNLLKEFGHPNLIVANNVFAHIPDIQDFTKGMSILADNNTVITIENPSFQILLNNAFFDTIYHEHYSYLSAHSVNIIANKFGLNLFHIDRLPTHGGSNRYCLSRSLKPDETVKFVLDEEKEMGLFDEKKWKNFAIRSKKNIEELRQWFIEQDALGNIVVGYGAAHKGNTFLNAVGEASKTLKYVVDASKEKQGKFLPGSQVPVLTPEQLNSGKPTDILILPWNIADEITEKINSLAPNVRIWIAQPSMKQIK